MRTALHSNVSPLAKCSSFNSSMLTTFEAIMPNAAPSSPRSANRKSRCRFAVRLDRNQQFDVVARVVDVEPVGHSPIGAFDGGGRLRPAHGLLVERILAADEVRHFEAHR